MKLTIFNDYKEEEWISMNIYSSNLCKELRRLDDKITLREFAGLDKLSRLIPKKYYKIRYLFRFLVNPGLSYFVQGDINHITDQANTHLQYFLNPKKTVITCHDLVSPYWGFGIMKNAAKIISVSEATKKEIIRKLNIDDSKIVVIPNGVENIFTKIKNKQKLEAFRNKYRIPAKFILIVGSVEKYKNIEFAIKVLAEILKKNKTIFLIKAGQPWTQSQKRIIKSLNLESNIINLGFVSKIFLLYLYNLASCLFQPSFVEGFGLTVLEAMACGCPVAVSDTQALKELVGDSGIVIDIKKARDTARQILEVDKNTKIRAFYINKGLKRSKLFNWHLTAQKTYQVYKSVLKQYK